MIKLKQLKYASNCINRCKSLFEDKEHAGICAGIHYAFKSGLEVKKSNVSIIVLALTHRRLKFKELEFRSEEQVQFMADARYLVSMFDSGIAYDKQHGRVNK